MQRRAQRECPKQLGVFLVNLRESKVPSLTLPIEVLYLGAAMLVDGGYRDWTCSICTMRAGEFKADPKGLKEMLALPGLHHTQMSMLGVR